MADESLIGVLLVDDHTIVRTGIAGMLSGAEGIRVAGEAANGYEALDAIARTDPDVILIDLRMPGLDGPDTIARLRQAGDTRAILVLTTFDADVDIVRAIESGANGYLLKDATRAELIDAIHAVARGESWLAPSVASRLLTQLRTPPGESLSDRELDVLRLVAKGRSNKEIASEIHVSPATVKTHLIHIFRKLDVNDRTAAVTAALERGIITIQGSD
jgi:DNA-binding NarL/FixJ family response regulator